MVRIFKILRVNKESKAFCNENRGYKAWLAGEPLLSAYPPGLDFVMKLRKDFEQLEGTGVVSDVVYLVFTGLGMIFFRYLTDFNKRSSK